MPLCLVNVSLAVLSRSLACVKHIVGNRTQSTQLDRTGKMGEPFRDLVNNPTQVK